MEWQGHSLKRWRVYCHGRSRPYYTWAISRLEARSKAERAGLEPYRVGLARSLLES